MGLGRIKYRQTLPLPSGDRKVISKRPYAQVHQTKVIEEENNGENIMVNKKIRVKFTREKQ